MLRILAAKNKQELFFSRQISIIDSFIQDSVKSWSDLIQVSIPSVLENQSATKSIPFPDFHLGESATVWLGL